MNFKNVNIIQDHLVAATISHFMSLERFWEEDSISQYQDFLELVAFFFEDYREEFIRLMEIKYNQTTTKDHIDKEVIVFISWCSQNAFHEVKQIRVE